MRTCARISFHTVFNYAYALHIPTFHVSNFMLPRTDKISSEVACATNKEGQACLTCFSYSKGKEDYQSATDTVIHFVPRRLITKFSNFTARNCYRQPGVSTLSM
jgi:hypothetical protein